MVSKLNSTTELDTIIREGDTSMTKDTATTGYVEEGTTREPAEEDTETFTETTLTDYVPPTKSQPTTAISTVTPTYTSFDLGDFLKSYWWVLAVGLAVYISKR